VGPRASVRGTACFLFSRVSVRKGCGTDRLRPRVPQNIFCVRYRTEFNSSGPLSSGIRQGSFGVSEYRAFTDLFTLIGLNLIFAVA
jgi:hypothetical protein